MTSVAVRLNDGPRLDGVRVLVVDDAPYGREAVTDILTQDGAASVLRAGFQLHVEKPIGLEALIGALAILALDRLRATSRADCP